MNILVSLKRFIANKNIVTILGVIIVIAILYFGYNYQVNQAITPISGIPVAKETIQPRTLITRDMITTIDVVPSMLKGNVIRTASSVIGKYSNYNTVIPSGSMFYDDTVVSQDEIPNSAFVKVNDGDVPYSFPVTMASTYGNSMMPGDYIDIYMKAKDDDGKLIIGKLVENIEILAVKDASGQNVFENSSESRIPSLMIFGVSEEINILLRKASYMSESSVVLFPVPHGGTAEVEAGTTQVSTLQLKDFINSHTVVIDEGSGEEEATDDTTTEETTEG
ncbi:MAG: hypothetical protein PHD02_01655 [Bacilli bacterium]|nr:hypothetical protein [Bacilli bacterium]